LFSHFIVLIIAATNDGMKKGKNAGQSAENLSVSRDESPPPGLKRQGTLLLKFIKDRGKQQGIINYAGIS